MHQYEVSSDRALTMPGDMGSRKTPLLFLALVPIFSVPFYLLEKHPLLPEGIAFISATALMVFVPMTLALAFTFKESGWRSVRRLLVRAVNVHQVKPHAWLLPTFLLLPVALCLAYLLSVSLGRTVGEPTALWSDAASTLLSFALLLYLFGIAEEVGWMGYAADPMQQRFGTLGAGLIIGMVWAAWHWVPWYRVHGLEWTIWQTLLTLLMRILIFWLYNNTGRSIFVCAIFHATFNVSYRAFPDQGAQYDPLAALMVVAVVTVLIMSIWGPKTLASYRFSMAGRS